MPFGALEQIDKELERLENLGVISRIEFSEWASPVVYVKKKNNKIRMCADFSTGLNDCLRNHTNPLPSPEDICASLNGEAIKSMPTPQNVVTLQAFLGLTNYYGIYIPKMHNLRVPLDKLLKKV